MNKLTLEDCKAAGIPVFVFGSPELAALHEDALEPEVLAATRGYQWRMNRDGMRWEAMKTYRVGHRVYGAKRDGFRYVVDHGGFYTLQLIESGQVVPGTLQQVH